MADPVYFDSSVFLAIFMGEKSGSSIKELLKELRRDKVRIYTSIITIQEVSVQTFRKGFPAADNYAKVNKLARIQGMTKEIALTAAKLEAQIIDQTAVKEQEDNKRRKWDCFHIATAMELGCRTFYASDNKMLKRKGQFGITGMDFSKPVPRSLPLLDETITPIEVTAGKTNGKDAAPAGEGVVDARTEPTPAAATAAATSDKLKADPAHPPAVSGGDSGRAQGEAAGEGKEDTKQQ